MARIRAKGEGDRQCVSISGRMTGRDLGRLERVCATTFEQRHLKLTLRIAAGTALDEPARAYLERLTRRGAVVLFEYRGADLREGNA